MPPRLSPAEIDRAVQAFRALLESSGRSFAVEAEARRTLLHLGITTSHSKPRAERYRPEVQPK